MELQSQAGEMKYGGIEAVSTTPPLIHLATTNDHVHIVEYVNFSTANFNVLSTHTVLSSPDIF